MKLKLIGALLLCACAGMAQDTVDHSYAARVIPFRLVSTFPGSCIAGEHITRVDLAPPNDYECVASGIPGTQGTSWVATSTSGGVSVTQVTTDPSGACTIGAPEQYNTTNGHFWGCASSAWTQISGSGTLPTANANTVVAGPTTGSPATATVRALVAPDLPSTLTPGTTIQDAALPKLVTAGSAITANTLLIQTGSGTTPTYSTATTSAGSPMVALASVSSGATFLMQNTPGTEVLVAMDNTAVFGDLVTFSPTTGGQAHDTGFSATSAVPYTTSIIGKVTQTGNPAKIRLHAAGEFGGSNIAPLAGPSFTGGVTVAGGLNVDNITSPGPGIFAFNSNPSSVTPTFGANTFTWWIPGPIATAFAWALPTADCNGVLTITSDVMTCGAGGSGAVSSVFGRTGAVVAAPNDYTAAQVQNALDISQTANQTLAGPITVPNIVLTNQPRTQRSVYSGSATVAVGNLLYPVALQVQQATVGVLGCAPMVAITGGAPGAGIMIGIAPYFVYQVISDNSTTINHYAGCSTVTAGYATDLGTTSLASIPSTTKVIGIWTASVTASGGATSGATLALFGDGVFGTLPQSTYYSCGTTSTCANTNTTSAHLHYAGSAALVSGTPSTVTISGMSPAFSSASSMFCTYAAEGSTPAALSLTKVSTSSITITGPNSSTIVVDWECDGR